MSDMQDDDIVDGEFDSVEFASYIYQQARAQGLEINATKLQKWLYICYGVYLADVNMRLLNEQPKAWPYGPVFPRVYRLFNQGGERALLSHPLNESFLLDNHMYIVQQVLNLFGSWTASQLSAWTHQPDEAWDKTIKQNNNSKQGISDHLIIQDFRKFLGGSS